MKPILRRLLPLILLPAIAAPVLSSLSAQAPAPTGTAVAIPVALPPEAQLLAGTANPLVPPAEVDRVPIALLVDLSSGAVLYAKEPDRRFLPASITKVMTIYTAFEMLSHGQIKVEQPMRMSEQAFRDWHNVGSTMFLDRSAQPKVSDLLLGIANVSANDGCVVLAEGAAGSVANWVALMNAEARRMGMADSHFGTPNGWMDEGETYVTAHDLATLAKVMITEHPEEYRHYIGHETLTWNGITQRNHDPILGKLEGADGIKTGFTNQAGYGFLGSAERNGRRLVMVIAGADRPADRARAAKALMNWGFDAFASKPLFPSGAKVGAAAVQGGAVRSVPLVTPAGFAASIPRDGGKPVSLRIVYDGPLQAPVAKGSIVAALEIQIGNDKPHQVPLIAGADVRKADRMERLRNGLLGLIS